MKISAVSTSLTFQCLKVQVGLREQSDKYASTHNV